MEEWIKFYKKDDFKGFIGQAKIKAAQQGKELEIYLAEQSNIFKRMIIGAHEEMIEKLKNTKSKDDEMFSDVK